MKCRAALLLTCLLAAALSSCTYREREADGDHSYSTIRLFPTD